MKYNPRFSVSRRRSGVWLRIEGFVSEATLLAELREAKIREFWIRRELLLSGQLEFTDADDVYWCKCCGSFPCACDYEESRRCIYCLNNPCEDLKTCLVPFDSSVSYYPYGTVGAYVLSIGSAYGPRSETGKTTISLSVDANSYDCTTREISDGQQILEQSIEVGVGLDYLDGVICWDPAWGGQMDAESETADLTVCGQVPESVGTWVAPRRKAEMPCDNTHCVGSCCNSGLAANYSLRCSEGLIESQVEGLLRRPKLEKRERRNGRCFADTLDVV